MERSIHAVWKRAYWVGEMNETTRKRRFCEVGQGQETSNEQVIETTVRRERILPKQVTT